MKKFTTNHETGEIILHPLGNPTTRANETIRDWTASLNTAFDNAAAGKLVAWEPTDPEDPRGPGSLVLVDPPPKPVPESALIDQICEALVLDGKDPDLIDGYIDGMTEGPEKKIAQYRWSKGSVVRRDFALVQVFAALFDYDDEGIDNLFRVAVTR